MKGCFVLRQSGYDGQHREACKAAHLCGRADDGLTGRGGGARGGPIWPLYYYLNPLFYKTL